VSQIQTRNPSEVIDLLKKDEQNMKSFSPFSILQGKKVTKKKK